MPVIINEFEVVSERPKGAPDSAAQTQMIPPQPNKLPQELDAVMHEQYVRMLRTRSD